MEMPETTVNFITETEEINCTEGNAANFSPPSAKLGKQK